MRNLVFVLVVTFCIGAPQAASACSCIAQPVLEYLDQADVAFTGKVIEKESHPREIDMGDGDKFELPFVVVKFKVDQSWKGVGGDEVTLVTHEEDGMCGYRFRTDGDYLVFGRFTSSDPWQELADISTGSCFGNKGMSQAAADIKTLDELLITTIVKPTLWGQIKALFY